MTLRLNVAEKLGMRRFHPWEAIGLRVLFASLLYCSLPIDSPFALGWFETDGRIPFSEQPLPDGIASFIDVTFMSRESVQTPLWILSVLALLSYIAGRGLLVSLPVLLGVFVLGRTLQNSQGFDFHGFKLMGLILLAQTLVIFGYSFRKWQARRGAREPRFGLNDYLIRFTQATIIAAYLIAGVSKIVESDGRWLQNSHYIGLYFAKTYRQNFYNELDQENYGKERVPYANTMLERPNQARLLMAGGLFLELFCFVALWSRWLALAVGASLVLFHRIVDEMMNLQFIENEILCVLFLVNPIYWVGMGLIWVIGKTREPRPRPTAP